jgi:hypothetical protein
MAAARTLSGNSKMLITSYSPKARSCARRVKHG